MKRNFNPYNSALGLECIKEMPYIQFDGWFEIKEFSHT